MASRSKALMAKGEGGRGCLWLFGGIFIVAGGAVFWFFSCWPLIQVAGAKSWEETPCVIDSSRLETFDGDDGDTYAPDIHYSYAFGDGDYEGDRYSFVSGSSSGRGRHQAVVDRYRAGSSAVCYVNPKAPEESILSIDVTGGYFFGLFGLIFVGAGSLVIFFGGRQGKSSGAKSRNARTSSHRFPETHDGPVMLKSSSSRIGKFVGITIFAVIWNGIISFALFGAGSGGGGSFGTYLFFTPFVLVGILVLAAAGHALLALFNPRVQLTVNRGSAHLGSEIEIDWALTGASNRIDQLHLWLEGREEATYTRGTDTYTDKHTFATIEIMKTDQRSEIVRGHATVAIPEYTMHSFDGGNNEIIWEFNVEGEIRRWPDVSNAFVYTVSPLVLKETR